MSPGETQKAAAETEDSPVVRVLARTGYAVLGVLHIMIGVIAISVAVGAGGGEADQSGAMRDLAQAPAGRVALWVIALGLFALTVWQAAQTVRVSENDAKKKWGKRILEASKGVVYVVLAVSAIVFALGGSKSSSSSTKSFSAKLIAAPGGVFVVFLIGLVVLGIAVAFLVRGITQKFTSGMRLPAPPLRTVIVTLGSIGFVAKGVALGVVGVLFCVAAVTLDPKKASGLDGALKTLAHLPFGAILLWIVEAGLIAYGLYWIARAPFDRL